MDHRSKTFVFIDNDGKAVKLFSRTFSFKVEEVLKNRFGKDLTAAADKLKTMPDFNLDDVKIDFPQLLTGVDFETIDWKVQDYDKILSVYFFFLLYKQNAAWNIMLQENEMNAFLIQTLTTPFSSSLRSTLQTES